MRKIITIVGTSIFENYLENKKDKSFSNFYENLIEKRAKDRNSEKPRVKLLEEKIEEWINEPKGNIGNISAEIKSPLKLLKEYILYIELVTIGSGVHNAEDEYVRLFKEKSDKVKNVENYKLLKIKKEV